MLCSSASASLSYSVYILCSVLFCSTTIINTLSVNLVIKLSNKYLLPSPSFLDFSLLCDPSFNLTWPSFIHPSLYSLRVPHLYVPILDNFYLPVDLLEFSESGYWFSVKYHANPFFCIIGSDSRKFGTIMIVNRAYYAQLS